MPVLLAVGLSICSYKLELTSKFGAHGTRAASSSAAKQAGVPIMGILSTGGWSSECTFARHYRVLLKRKMRLLKQFVRILLIELSVKLLRLRKFFFLTLLRLYVDTLTLFGLWLKCFIVPFISLTCIYHGFKISHDPSSRWRKKLQN